ncbi:MAG: hypothetical protein V3R73_02580, partial [Sphingomonadales bacterium]
MALKTSKKKIALWIFGGLIGMAAIFIVNLIWFKPFFVNHFYNRVFVEFVFDSPQSLTSMRLLEQIGINGHNANLDDQSLAFEDKQRALLRKNYEILMSYDDAGLEGQKLLSKRILSWFLGLQLEQDEFRHHNYPLNQLFGV